MKSTGCLLHVGQFNVDSPKGSTVHSVFWEIIWLSSTSVEIQLYLNHVRMNAKSNSHSFFSTMNVSFAGLATVHAFWIHEKSRRRLKIWKNFSQILKSSNTCNFSGLGEYLKKEKFNIINTIMMCKMLVLCTGIGSWLSLLWFSHFRLIAGVQPSLLYSFVLVLNVRLL